MDQLGEQFAAKLQELERTRDPQPLMALFSEDVELKRSPQSREYHGLEGARDFWDEYLRMFSDVATTFDVVTEAGDRAALEWHSVCRLENGAEVTYQGCTVIQSDGEHVNSLRTYYDSASVLRPHAATAT
jgi:ketosteroid isomerase-like protein